MLFSTPPSNNHIFNINILHFLKVNSKTWIIQDINMVYVFYFACCFCHLKICWLKCEHFSEGNENHLQRHGTERVNPNSLSNLIHDLLLQGSLFRQIDWMRHQADTHLPHSQGKIFAPPQLLSKKVLNCVLDCKK